ncbi:hypothetical protein DFH28DRAFT_905540, partial [Melampsora americana]
MPIIVRGPVSRSKTSLKSAFGDCFVSNVGRCDKVCESCQALCWDKERTKQFQGTRTYKYSNCCQSGKVMLPSFYFPQDRPPETIMWLLTSMDQDAVVARRRIRDYNNVLSFTS